MRSLDIFLLFAFPLAPVLAREESPSRVTVSRPFDADTQQAFHDLLNALPEESLHVALNSLSRYRPGVFDSHRHGVEKVHDENPPLATRLIVAAVEHLKKRQVAPSNGTVPEPSPTSTPDGSGQDEGAPPVVIPVPITTTDEGGNQVVSTSEILSEATASVEAPVTRTNEQGSTEITTETRPAVILTTTDSAGSAITTTSAGELLPTSGQVLTRTNTDGSRFVTTYTPTASKISSIKLITTTGGDGKIGVVTSYTYVDPAGAVETGTDTAPGGRGNPSLQKGAANRGITLASALVIGSLAAGVFAVLA